VKIDKLFDTYNPTTFVSESLALEAAGYDGLVIGEAVCDPLVTLAVASQHAASVDLVTGILLALVRSPTAVAYAANDLQALSGGRLVLGLGSQIRAHIERRFSARWVDPVGQMREYVLAIRAIFDAWANREGIDFRGDHYQITLMTPFFSPPVVAECPPLWMAAVGPKMCETAAEVADAVIVHGFTTERYLRENICTWLERGRAKSGRPEPTDIAMPVMIATGSSEDELADATAAVRKQIAFYGSTPAYRVVLDHHGWGELQPELNTLSKQGRWNDMTTCIDDEVVDTFAIRGDVATVARELVRRFGDLLTRVSIYTPNYHARTELMAELLSDIRSNIPQGSGLPTA
jgi:probable F420-dependent oxidoreductase